MKHRQVNVEYGKLVRRWRDIVAQPLSREARQAECLAALRDHVDAIAAKRTRESNRPLRLYADMLVLKEQLYPVFAVDEFGQIAIRPAYRFVNEWLEQHSVN